MEHGFEDDGRCCHSNTHTDEKENSHTNALNSEYVLLLFIMITGKDNQWYSAECGDCRLLQCVLHKLSGFSRQFLQVYRRRHHHNNKLVANKAQKGCSSHLSLSLSPSLLLFLFHYFVFNVRMLGKRYDDILIINFY